MQEKGPFPVQRALRPLAGKSQRASKLRLRTHDDDSRSATATHLSYLAGDLVLEELGGLGGILVQALFDP